jgi:hypothetical protein
VLAIEKNAALATEDRHFRMVEDRVKILWLK